MERNVSFYEVEITFLAETGAVIPITASSEQEAKEIAEYLFRDHQNLNVKSVRDITKDPNKPNILLN